jgi:hypothetical protein
MTRAAESIRNTTVPAGKMAIWKIYNMGFVVKTANHWSIGVTEQVYAHLMPEVSKNATDETIDAMRSMKNEE